MFLNLTCPQKCGLGWYPRSFDKNDFKSMCVTRVEKICYDKIKTTSAKNHRYRACCFLRLHDNRSLTITCNFFFWFPPRLHLMNQKLHCNLRDNKKNATRQFTWCVAEMNSKYRDKYVYEILSSVMYNIYLLLMNVISREKKIREETQKKIFAALSLVISLKTFIHYSF